jgi:hypothetical protein
MVNLLEASCRSSIMLGIEAKMRRKKKKKRLRRRNKNRKP